MYLLMVPVAVTTGYLVDAPLVAGAALLQLVLASSLPAENCLVARFCPAAWHARAFWRHQNGFFNARTFFHLKPGTKIQIKESVFPRLKDKKKPNIKEEVVDNLIDINEFAKAELVVAEVLEAAKVEGADKLLRLQIDIGTEKRQIVAGIAQHYAPDNIVGKKIIVVKNLKPAKIRGIQSKGMLLAATKKKDLTLLTLDKDLPVGAKIS